MIDVNSFSGLTDSEVLDNAFASLGGGGTVVIPARRSAVQPERTWWLLDRAIQIPANTTVILRDCRIKLSDRCRDNFFRTANCGLGIEDPQPIENVHIRGEGLCSLEGADNPRSTGDGSKRLACPCPHLPEDLVHAPWVAEERRSPEKLSFWDMHSHSYGTDALDANESPWGDWRNVGVLFANAQNFSVEGLTVVNAHGWAMSFEGCSHGRISRIRFDATMSHTVNGMLQNRENQDGIDLRTGCSHITISDITGRTGDDVVALTAYVGTSYIPGGSLRTTQVMHNDYTRRSPDIHDISIRNIMAESHLCYLVRLLAGDTHIYNVTVDGVVDTSTQPGRNFGSFVIGTAGAYGNSHPDGIRHINITNVISNGKRVFDVKGYLADSLISNVINKNPNAPLFACQNEDSLQNVKTANLPEG